MNVLGIYLKRFFNWVGIYTQTIFNRQSKTLLRGQEVESKQGWRGKIAYLYRDAKTNQLKSCGVFWTNAPKGKEFTIAPIEDRGKYFNPIIRKIR